MNSVFKTIIDRIPESNRPKIKIFERMGFRLQKIHSIEKEIYTFQKTNQPGKQIFCTTYPEINVWFTMLKKLGGEEVYKSLSVDEIFEMFNEDEKIEAIFNIDNIFVGVSND